MSADYDPELIGTITRFKVRLDAAAETPLGTLFKWANETHWFGSISKSDEYILCAVKTDHVAEVFYHFIVTAPEHLQSELLQAFADAATYLVEKKFESVSPEKRAALIEQGKQIALDAVKNMSNKFPDNKFDS